MRTLLRRKATDNRCRNWWLRSFLKLLWQGLGKYFLQFFSVISFSVFFCAEPVSLRQIEQQIFLFFYDFAYPFSHEVYQDHPLWIAWSSSCFLYIYTKQQTKIDRGKSMRMDRYILFIYISIERYISGVVQGTNYSAKKDEDYQYICN